MLPIKSRDDSKNLLPVKTPYQPKTGAKCSCKNGIQRDNCPNCEGTGMVIDFVAIRNRNRKVTI
jgi:hypothetical protein